MRILVTGAGGFVGRHLVRELSEHGHEPVALDSEFVMPVEDVSDTCHSDLRDAAGIDDVVASMALDACVHLGALSFVPAGTLNPGPMFDVNVLGSVNVLEAIRRHAAGAIVLLVSTSQVYGLTDSVVPLKEDAPLRPANMYAISKAASDLTAQVYAREHGLRTVIARPGNHTGPGQSARFVVPALASQVAAIARGDAPAVMDVGNVESERDFLDVRDVVRAYRLLLESDLAAGAYNIGSERRVKIKTVVDELCRIAGVNPTLRVDPEKFRPRDCAALLDTGKLTSDTGWQPEISLAGTLSDVLGAL